MRYAALSFLAAFMLAILPLPAAAQYQETLSADYLTGMAFFKFAKVEPDFRTWVLNSPAYKSGMPRDRAMMLRSEVPRLQNMFANYVIEEHPIHIKADMKIILPAYSKAKKMLQDGGMVVIPIELEQEEKTFFPIPVADMWIALIPKDLDFMMDIELNAEEYEDFNRTMKNLGLNGRVNGKLNLTLMPIQADTYEPLIVRGYQFWMLMAKVTSFELWTDNGDGLQKMMWRRDILGAEIDGQEAIFNLKN